MSAADRLQEVIVVSSRAVTNADAFAVARALESCGFKTDVVDALMRPLSTKSAGSPPSPAGNSSPIDAHGVKNALRKLLLTSDVSRVAVLARGVALDRRRWRGRLQRSRPAAIVMFDDRRVRPELVVLEAARQHDVPVILVPFAISTMESDLFLRRDRCELEVGQKPWRRTKDYIAETLPAQVRASREGRRYTFFTPLETVFLYQSGLLPKSAWVWGGAGVDAICALGDDHIGYLVDGGVERARIFKTGQPSLDALAKSPSERKELRAQLSLQYRIQNDRPLVICAVPQHGEHALTDWETHWRLTDELFDALAQSGCEALLSLHPKSKRSDYEARVRKFGLAILSERLSDVLPAADILVGTFSSTIPWATGLGIPAIVVDALDSKYELFRNQDGIEVLRSHGDLLQRLREFSGNAAALEKARDAAAQGSERVGRIDGRNASRVAAIVANLVTNKAGHPEPAGV